MGFYRPYKHRHLPRDPGVYTHPLVGWLLVAVIGFILGCMVFGVGAVFYLAVR